MADITISDLELAPALADDMVLPVENTTDTYAATLAMLRRLINKTFVEVEDANFNDLTDDGFYQCTGTPTNAPEVGAINWTLQVSAESGVVVQRAFSLDDRFENFYIRRFNGVMWTAWKNMTNVVGTPFSLGDSRYFETAPYNASWLASNGQYNSSIIYPSMWGQLQVELSNIKVGEVGTYNGYSYTKRGLPVVLSTDTITDYDFVVNQNDQTFRFPLKNGEEYLPGTAYEDLTFQASNFTYTAPANGSFSAIALMGGAYSNFQIRRNGVFVSDGYGSGTIPIGDTVNLRKGDVVISNFGQESGTPTKITFRFTYAKGNGTLYYYVGDTVQDASLINAGAVLGQLSDKISRTVASDKELVIGWGMPDYSAGVALSPSTLTTITTKGWINYTSIRTNAIGGVTVSNVLFQSGSSATNDRGSMMIPVDVGDTVQGVVGGSDTVTFYPCKGV